MKLFFAVLFALLLAARLRHVEALWPEETLPMAAAAQMLDGKTLYQEAWFDKPPLLAGVYMFVGARPGWALRLLGALHALVACWLAFRIARETWSDREGLWAAGLLGFFLVFDFPSASVPLAADLLMLVPHLAAVWLVRRGKWLAAGLALGIAFQINNKAAFALAACMLWDWRVIVGFAIANAGVVGWYWLRGAAGDYWQQVWWWSGLYARDTFVEDPWRHGIIRTLSWAGFHATAVIGAAWTLKRERDWKLAAWLALSLASVILGLRFFPRYYWQVLPAAVILASHAMTQIGVWRYALVALLAVPAVRFARWNPDDLALDRDSRDAAMLVRHLAGPRSTLFVWGFRAELFPYTRLPAGTRFLECQPMTGVAADRHLFNEKSLMPELAARHRAELVLSRPEFVIDGLGPLNPKLAMTAYPEVAEWLKSNYVEVARTKATVIWKRR